ncbi:MAG: peptide deformylase [Bacillota bacterium]
MPAQPILLLGDPLLWQHSMPVPVPGQQPMGAAMVEMQHAAPSRMRHAAIVEMQHAAPIRTQRAPTAEIKEAAADEALHQVRRLHTDLRDTLLRFRRKGIDAKAIAAPQIGVLKRVVYVHEPGPSTLLVNPVLKAAGPPVLTWENCLSFPGLSVKTRRASSCVLTYLDESLTQQSHTVTGDLAVVVQHECDHLDGILCLERAADAHSFFLSAKGRVPPELKPAHTG